tara:strand:- start:2317 stop:3159 length:843 start_codon:yes stop_codon:yes gene_type:complete
MVQKSISLLIIFFMATVAVAFAQEEDSAPKISISFADQGEENLETAAPAAEPSAAEQPVAQPTEEGKPRVQYTEEEGLFAIYGWFLVHRNKVDLLELTEKERLAFLSGVNTALAKREITGWEQHMPAVQKLMDDRWQPVYEQMQRDRKAATVDLFTELANKEEVKKTATGLYYQLVSEGTGKFPTPESVVHVEFVARLVDGTVFETSDGRGGPVPLVLATMVAGVREGLLLVREGGIIKLWLPASLGFGSEEQNGIPADSALLFDFEVHEVTEAPPQGGQ